MRYLDLQVDEAIEIAEYTISKSPMRYPQQRTWSVSMISPLIWELPKTAFVYARRLRRVRRHNRSNDCKWHPTVSYCRCIDFLLLGCKCRGGHKLASRSAGIHSGVGSNRRESAWGWLTCVSQRFDWSMLMASASSLHGLMTFLRREEWREAFEEIRFAHLFVACRTIGVEIDEIADILGEQAAATLWGCAFEDFLARDRAGGGNMVDDYLKRRGYKESATAKAYMKAIRCSVMSLYEVSGIEPGQSFLARDLVRGGEPVRVMERTATTHLRPWERIGARIVPLVGTHQMCGGLLPYDMETADKLLQKLRWFEARVGNEMGRIVEEFGNAATGITLETIAPSGSVLEFAAPIFTRIWLIDALEKALNPRGPMLLNSEGDDILFCTQRFPLADSASVGQMQAALAAIGDLREAGENFFNWIGPKVEASDLPASNKPGLVLMTSHSEGGTVLGGVEITASEVIVTTNSRERADRARDMIAAGLGPLVGAPLMETETSDETMERDGPSSPQSELPMSRDEKRRLTHSFLDDHYRKTLDKGLAVLDGLTPRESARTSAGREKVVAWLKYLENQAHQQCDEDDALASYDLTWMWKELAVAECRV